MGKVQALTKNLTSFDIYSIKETQLLCNLLSDDIKLLRASSLASYQNCFQKKCIVSLKSFLAKWFQVNMCLVLQVTPDGCGGPVVRLKSFLEKTLKEGRVPPPNGLLPPNFW